MHTSSPIRTFGGFLGEAEDGQLQADLTKALSELVATISNEAADRGGKPKGKLTLSIALQLDHGAFDVVCDIKVAAPKCVRARSIFFATPDNNLTREHPRQQMLPLHDVATQRKEVI